MNHYKYEILEKYSDNMYLCKNHNSLAFFIKTFLVGDIHKKKEVLNDRLSYELSYDYKLIDEDEESEFSWNVLKYKYVDNEDKELFINFCYDLQKYLFDNVRSNKQFSKIINTHCDIFTVKKNDTKKLIGRFGELFLIYKIFLITNGKIDLTSSYQMNGYEIYDFKIGDFCLDVKSKLSSANTIHLTKNQILNVPNIALVTLYYSHDGLTLLELIEKMESLGINFISNYIDSIKKEFSSDYSRFDIDFSNIKYVSNKDIPNFSAILSDNHIIDLNIELQLNPKKIYDIDKLIGILGGLL